jgi:hypothetical protein
MIIVDPVTFGDVACTRASVKWVWDRTGTLVSVPANTLAVTYDPSDLSKAPYALVEAAATNLQPYSENGDNWIAAGATPPGYTNAATYLGIKAVKVDFDQSMTPGYAGCRMERNAFKFPIIAGTAYVASCFVSLSRALVGNESIIVYFTGVHGSPFAFVTAANSADFVGKFARIVVPTNVAGMTGTDYFVVYVDVAMRSPLSVYVTRLQAEVDKLTSYIPTTSAAVTRPADVIATGAGVISSNVPETEKPAYVPGTYAAGDQVIFSHVIYESKVAANTAAPTDATKWLAVGATNQRNMLDQYNNTQTTQADEILLVVSPQAISQGLYLGNLFADEVRASVVDLTDGLVYREENSLIVSNSGSSFFNWCFKRIKRKSYFITQNLPVYANALITICIRKIGGTAACGMCAVGPLDEFGPSLMGLSTEGKDYSSTTFNFDGTSSTVIRPYAKRMSVDVVIDNTEIDYVQERLFEYRQRPIVWIGGPYGCTAVFGRYGSFKNVIESYPRSKMALQIEGSV